MGFANMVERSHLFGIICVPVDRLSVQIAQTHRTTGRYTPSLSVVTTNSSVGCEPKVDTHGYIRIL